MKSGLQNLRSQLGGRVSSVQARDANAMRQEVSTETSFVYTSRLALIQGGRPIDIKANGELGRVSIFGEFDLSHFTVHSKDRSGFASISIGPVRIGPFDYEVFTKDGVVTSSQSRLLRSVELADLMSVHPFRSGEALHFYRNCLILYARAEDLSSLLVRRMVALAKLIPEDKAAADAELPAEFADLVNVVKDWGISDDQERSDKIQYASEGELKQFLAIVEPRVKEIISYLGDTGQNSKSEAAANLERILEAMIEAKTALVGRNPQNK